VRLLSILVGLVVEAPVAVATTLVAVRLLGIRRSWVAVTLAGAIGWSSGNLLHVALAGWDWDAARLSVATITLSIVFTAIAALGLDFAARPGTLARPDRAGLIVVPRPWRDLARWLEPYARYRELIGIARQNGLLAGMGRGGRHRRSAPGRVPLGVALRKTLEQSGVVFVKLGQMASTRADLLPADVREELSRLQSRVEPAPREAMQAQLESELGAGVDEVFAEFDWEPIGAASIAQAYAARLKSGDAVIVKVQRPGIDDLVERDTAALLRLARAIEQRTPQGRELRVSEAAEEFVRLLQHEFDFLHEAANTVEMAKATDPDSGVRIPRVYSELVTRRMLVQERFKGTSVQYRQRMIELGLDSTELADRLARATVGHVVRGAFHADLHPGNVLLLENGDLGLIDFGLIGHLDPVQRVALLQITAAAMRGDSAGLRDGIQQVATIGDDVTDALLERALAHFLAEHVVPGQPVDIQAMNDLIPLLATFEIRLPRELTTFFRALLQLDGTIRTIHPGYSLVDGMGRVLDGQSITSGLTAGGTLQDQLRDELMLELPRLKRLPAHIDRIATLAARGELRARVALFSTERDARVLSTLVNRVVLGMVGGLLTVGSTLLLTTTAGPHVTGDATFAQVFGFVGLGVAAILLFRVIAGIVREGHN
jgi:ubiquinone biosynthesis protein